MMRKENNLRNTRFRFVKRHRYTKLGDKNMPAALQPICEACGQKNLQKTILSEHQANQ